MTTQFLSGIHEIADQYDAFIIDLWGVLHDGYKLYAHALESLKQLKALKKITFLLSNSPRRAILSEVHLAHMGLTRNLYTYIYTSGEDTHQSLKNRPNAWYQKLGHRLFYIGRETYEPMFSNLPYEEVCQPKDADFFLITSADFQNLSDYDAIFQVGLERKLPLICANPDRIVIEGDQIIICSGSVAERYEQLGGEVYYHGKPHPAIYQPVFSFLKDIPLFRTLAIGDSLATDIQGAKIQKVDTTLIMNGIHKETVLEDGNITPKTPKLLEKLSAEVGIVPHYALRVFNW